MNLFRQILIIFFLFFSFSTNLCAITPNSIYKLFQGGKKLIMKGDEVTDTGKAIENLKGGSKIDDTAGISSQIDEVSSVKYNENTINEIENLNNDEIFEKHGIKKLKNLDGVIDIIDGVEISKSFLETTLIHEYIDYTWEGKVFKNSKYFKSPEIEKKILIKCNSNFETLYFTAILNQQEKNYLLLSGNFIKKKSGLFKPPMKRQEMLVLGDREEYIFFSNKPKDIKKYPSKYFAIFNNKNLLYEINLNNANNPNDIAIKLNEKEFESSFNCERLL
tara:strand:- start:1801 stop:2628 length:828 start_codon:yes stop_codon:yes gene_type:complete